MNSAFMHGTKRLLSSLHGQHLTNLGFDVGPNDELDQAIHLLPSSHDSSAHGNLLNEKPNKIRTGIVAGGNSHCHDHPDSTHRFESVRPRRLTDIVHHCFDAAG